MSNEVCAEDYTGCNAVATATNGYQEQFSARAWQYRDERWPRTAMMEDLARFSAALEARGFVVVVRWIMEEEAQQIAARIARDTGATLTYRR